MAKVTTNKLNMVCKCVVFNASYVLAIRLHSLDITGLTLLRIRSANGSGG